MGYAENYIPNLVGLHCFQKNVIMKSFNNNMYYLETGSESEKLLRYEAVATGFTDSELKILYQNDED